MKTAAAFLLGLAAGITAAFLAGADLPWPLGVAAAVALAASLACDVEACWRADIEEQRRVAWQSSRDGAVGGS